MKTLLLASATLLIQISGIAQTTKPVSDCTVTFTVSVEDNKADPAVVKSMAGTTKVLYIKGTRSRSDLVAPGFKQTTLFDTKSDSTVILRELGSAKYISYLTASKRQEKNRKYEGIQFNKTNDRKTILGYDCNKAIAKLADGSTYDVYYTTAFTTTNNEYEYQFRDLPGFVLEYESQSEDGKIRVKYSASQILLTPVPIALFDLPKSGYRIL